MPDDTPVRLTKAELAALDFIIAEAEETGSTSFISPLATAAVAKEVVKALAKEAVFEAAREFVRHAVEKIAGRPFPQGIEPDTLEFRQLEERLIHEVGPKPSLEDLKRVRELVTRR